MGLRLPGRRGLWLGSWETTHCKWNCPDGGVGTREQSIAFLGPYLFPGSLQGFC